MKTFTSLPTDTKSAVGSGFVSELTGKELVGTGMLGLGAGASILTGFGVFVAAGYMSMSSMADAANRRASDLRTLMEKALPAAQALVGARKREVAIAGLMQQIAQSDLSLAQDLITFEENRTLNLNFWANLAQILRRMLRRYLELGARAGWLAERALAFELDQKLSIIRMDYFPEKLQGITGANLLETDLAELEATRIENVKRTVPVRHTLSLARDYPLQYGQLKQTGVCSFRTEELPLQVAYPGTSGYRLRALSVEVSQIDPRYPLRAILVNQGVSVSRPNEPDAHILVRPADALPLSEFRLREHMAIYSLPDETLLTFEGSNIETFWELRFPPAANPNGLDGLADVLLTFDLRAQYSLDLYARHVATAPASVRRWILLSGAKYQPKAVADLANLPAPVTIPFDVRQAGLPAKEKHRRIKNVSMFFVARTALNVKATLNADQPSTPVKFEFTNGVAMSTVPPAPLPALPPSPLDKLVDSKVDQVFRVLIDKALNPAADFTSVTDLVFGIEYQADLA